MNRCDALEIKRAPSRDDAMPLKRAGFGTVRHMYSREDQLEKTVKKNKVRRAPAQPRTAPPPTHTDETGPNAHTGPGTDTQNTQNTRNNHASETTTRPSASYTCSLPRGPAGVDGGGEAERIAHLPRHRLMHGHADALLHKRKPRARRPRRICGQSAATTPRANSGPIALPFFDITPPGHSGQNRLPNFLQRHFVLSYM